MAQIGNIPEIKEVKEKLTLLQENGKIKQWELPYENLLTRVTAAVFFLTPAATADLDTIWQELDILPGFTCRENTERVLSQLDWRVEYNRDFAL